MRKQQLFEFSWFMSESFSKSFPLRLALLNFYLCGVNTCTLTAQRKALAWHYYARREWLYFEILNDEISYHKWDLCICFEKNIVFLLNFSTTGILNLYHLLKSSIRRVIPSRSTSISGVKNATSYICSNDHVQITSSSHLLKKKIQEYFQCYLPKLRGTEEIHIYYVHNKSHCSLFSTNTIKTPLFI